jgi:hypothetical protein
MPSDADRPESAARAHRRWILGRYVQLIALLQLMVYATDGLARQPNPALFYFNPRFLMEIATEALARGHHEFPSGLSWASLFAFLALGEGIVQSRRGLAAYTLVEGAYAILFMAFAALIVAANLTPAHGFSVGELITPLAVFAVASAGPLLVALPLWLAPDHGV